MHTFFSIWLFFQELSRFTGQQGKREAISVTALNHFYLLYRHMDISLAITARSSPLHVVTSRTRTGSHFPSANRQPLSYAPLTSLLMYFINHVLTTIFTLSFSREKEGSEINILNSIKHIGHNETLYCGFSTSLDGCRLLILIAYLLLWTSINLMK